MEDIKQNLTKVLNEIRIAEKEAGRQENSVKLLAVSKFHTKEEIIQAINQGQIFFGENRVQEVLEKFPELKQEFPQIELHIIGQLQTNKVKKALLYADYIESVDRLPLLEEIEKQASKLDKKIKVLFEVHTGEESKSGFESFESLENAVDFCAQNKAPHIIPCGFMTMAPFTQNQDLIRKSFQTLKEYSKILREKYSQLPLNELSMGMSADFKIAIQEGSTQVRVGTNIFGQRNYN